MTRMFPDTTPALAEPSPAMEAPARLRRRDRVEVCKSGVHRRGVYAMVTIACGKKIIEYKGEHIMQKEASCRHPYDPSDPNHIFYFSLEGGSVIDAKYGGNRTRQVDHACKPNCEVRETDGRVFIHMLYDIEVGEELFYDCGLVIESRQTKALKERFVCHCGTKKCRGTMLASPEKTKKK